MGKSSIMVDPNFLGELLFPHTQSPVKITGCSAAADGQGWSIVLDIEGDCIVNAPLTGATFHKVPPITVTFEPLTPIKEENK